MDYGTQQLNTLQQQIQQIQNLMNRPAPQPQPQKVVSTVPIVDGLIGARQYLETLGPSSSAAVFDKSDAVFFLLSVDANGNRAPIKVGKFTLEDAPESGTDNITKADLDAFRAEIRDMIRAMKGEEE